MAEETPPSVFRTPVWSIQLTPAWHAEERGDHVALLNDTGDSQLLITAYGVSHTQLTARQWIEFAASVHPPKGRPLVEVRCGDFTGYHTEFAVFDSPVPPVGQDRWLRSWMLESNGVPLDVTYTCPLSDAGRDNEAIASMLDTLRFTGPANLA